MKKLLVGTLIGALFLSGCANQSAINTTITNDLTSVGQAISSDYQILTADAAPAACAVASSVATYGSALSAAGALIGVDVSLVATALSAVASIANSTLCTTLLNGGSVANPLNLIQDISQAINAVTNATNGKVTAAAAVAPTSTTASSNVGAARFDIYQKMARFNDRLRFKLFGLKHRTTIHY